MAEELRLVERFEELRAGMLVVIKPCLWCGRGHRGMLVRLDGPLQFRDPDGSRTEPAHCWYYEPQPSRCPARTVGRGRMNVSRFGIDDGRVFRVVDGLEAPAETTKVRKPVKVDR